MKTTVDTVIIKAIKDENAVHQVPGTDIKLQLLSKFREYDEDIVTQSGTVMALPIRITGNGRIELEVGDKVYCHHFLTHDENDASFIEENAWKMKYDSIYCKVVDGEIIMLGQWNFLEIVMDENMTESGLYLKPTSDKIIGCGVMRHPSNLSKEYGIKEGMKIEFKKNAGYLMIVEGKTYYRLRDEHLCGVHEYELV